MGSITLAGVIWDADGIEDVAICAKLIINLCVLCEEIGEVLDRRLDGEPVNGDHDGPGSQAEAG